MHTTVRDVVQLVLGGADEPPWLEGRIAQMSATIRSFNESEDRAPLRTDMRARLDCFREAAVRLREDLTDSIFEAFIGTDWSDVPLEYHKLLDALELLGNRASAVSMRLAGRGGSTRAYPTNADDAISAQQLCAWTVIEAMKRSRPDLRVVLADNREAWHAANALWKLSGGIPLGAAARIDADGREPSGWRTHIIAVRESLKAQDRRTRWLEQMGAMFEALNFQPSPSPDHSEWGGVAV